RLSATTRVYSLSLHDALPIFGAERYGPNPISVATQLMQQPEAIDRPNPHDVIVAAGGHKLAIRAERHRADHRRTMLRLLRRHREDRKSTRLNSSHVAISYAVF